MVTMVKTASALRKESDNWMSLATMVISSPEASTAPETVCVPVRLLTPVVPPCEPVAPPPETTRTFPVVMIETFARSLLTAFNSAASTTIANGLNRKS